MAGRATTAQAASAAPLATCVPVRHAPCASHPVAARARRAAAARALTVCCSVAQGEKVNAKSVAAVILGGGAGTRLYPLTKQRAKPAVPIGGAYRLIDVPMSNCINSGISKMYVLTQVSRALRTAARRRMADLSPRSSTPRR